MKPKQKDPGPFDLNALDADSLGQDALDPGSLDPGSLDERPAAQQLAALVKEVAADAQGRAETYPRETVVPEGGE